MIFFQTVTVPVTYVEVSDIYLYLKKPVELTISQMFVYKKVFGAKPH